jgi:hypothetical protein
MKIYPPIQSNLSQSQPINKDLLALLRPGNALNATVLAYSSDGVAKLRIGQHILQTNSQIPLSAGQLLKIAVSKEDTQIILNIKNKLQLAELISKELRINLPKQRPIAELMTLLNSMVPNSNRQALALPEIVTDIIRQLYKNIPDTNKIATVKVLKDALNNSGISYENKIKNLNKESGQSSIASDLKGRLLTLLQALRTANPQSGSATDSAIKSPLVPVSDQTVIDKIRRIIEGKSTVSANRPTQSQHSSVKSASAKRMAPNSQQAEITNLLQTLTRQVEGSLARIQTQQLVSLSHNEPGEQQWVVDLPIRYKGDIDVVKIMIENNKHNNRNNSENLWRVTLTFELRELGSVCASLSLLNEKVSVIFSSENEKTAQLFKQHLQTLQNRLDDAGVKTGSFVSKHHQSGPIFKDMSLTSQLVNYRT